MATTAMQKRDTQQNQVNVPERLEQARYFSPLVDIYENDDAFVFQADLPGVKPADLDIRYDNGVLAIEGKVAPRQPAEQNYVWR